MDPLPDLPPRSGGGDELEPPSPARGGGSGRGRLTPKALLLTALLCCCVAALFGAAPLAAWTANTVPALQQATETWQSWTAKFGLDRPYDTLRHLTRDAESTRFAPAD